jgi:cell division septal protein FtsQ
MLFSKTSKKTILILCGLTFVFMAVVTGLYWDNYFFIVKKTKVNFVQSTVNRSIKEEAEQKVQLVLGKIERQNIWRLNLEEIRDSLLSNNWIENVSIERELPDGLRVEVKFKTIVFLYGDRSHRLLPVSTQGTILSPVPVELAPDVPLIRNSKIVTNKETLLRVIALYKKLPADGLISARNISEVDWSEAEGFKVDLNQSEEGFIVLGTENISMKAKRVESVLKYLESQKQRWRVIDASFSKKVLVRLRKRS